MFRPRIIPTLLLKNKGLIKTIRFNKKKAKYIGDPINAVKIFNDLKADELVFLDVLASKNKKVIDFDLVKDIGDEAFMPFGVGGGISCLDHVDRILNNGAEKVILNTEAYLNPSLIEEIASKYGSQSVSVCVDVKRNMFSNENIMIAGGSKKVKQKINDYIKVIESNGAGEIIVQSIDKDGTMEGYDIELIKKISKQTTLPVVALGGASNVSDFEKAYTDGGASALSAGSMFVLHGPRKAVLINYPDKEKIKKNIRWI
jgi:cyclase